MSQFDNVTVLREANVYFDGKVTSRTVLFPGGEKRTLGIMLPGEYEFGTADREVMEILSGSLEVRLPGREEWLTVGGGDTFEVPASAKLQLRVHAVTDYCCSYYK